MITGLHIADIQLITYRDTKMAVGKVRVTGGMKPKQGRISNDNSI